MNTDNATTGRHMILVLGAHRSGTSAVAGTLSHLGVDFSEHLVPPATDNPKGFFEHADIWRLDHSVLESLGSAWDDPLALPPGWRESDAVLAAARQAGSVLQRDFADAPLAGIKDPRMCRLVSLWRPWLRAAGFSDGAVLVLRRPAETIASLASRDGLPADQAAWVWLRHNLEAERDTRGMPRIVVAYEPLLADWRNEADRIAAALGIEWPRAPDRAGTTIDAFLESNLRHHRDVHDLAQLDEPLRDWVERAYIAMTGLADADLAVLDRIATEVAHADGLARAAAAVLRHARTRQHGLERDLQWVDNERKGLVEGNADLRANLERHVEELAKTKLGAQDLEANLDRHIQALADAMRDNQELRGGLAQVSANLAAVYASRSWRITRPIRGTSRMARRVMARLRALREPAVVAAPPSASAPIAADSTTTLEAAFAAASGPRVLIVTPDIQGPIRNGGIGTAFAALARTLAGAGRAVTILYTLGNYTEGGEAVEHWQRHYAGLGIRFIPVSLEQGEPLLDAPHHAWRAYRVYLWLKEHQHDFDLAYFPEWKGEAYYALQAKRVGLDFAGLGLVIVTHSSTTWAESGNYVVPQRFDDLLLEFLERRSVELADAVISPSQYMLDWMQHRGWRWAGHAHVIQNLMPDAPVEHGADVKAFAVHEWVFFGRLERRKGLIIFLDALKRMPPEVRARIQITFLGKAIHTPDYDSAQTIHAQLGDWNLQPKLITDYGRDDALTYLEQPGRVAVIASLVENSPYTVLECVLKRIPFIAADVGGIAELVHPEDRGRALFKPTPTSLAAALAALDGTHYLPPRPAVPVAQTRQRWLELQDQLLREIPAPPAEPTAPPPHITVCLVHFDRPWLLAQAIDSLRQQTYGHFDVVLVDDGSPSDAAQQYLDGLEDEFAWRHWTIVRQANSYLGAARNHAVRHARGEYVLFMDDDNLAKPHELATFAQAACVTQADILTTVSDVFFDADGAPRPGQASRQLWIPLGSALGLGVFRNVFGDANALIRRKTFLALGGFTEDYGIGHEDWEFFARAVIAGANLQLVPEPLFWYRVNDASMLRGGDRHVDNARSVRPYWEGLPSGVGPALAYAMAVHHRPPTATAPWALAQAADGTWLGVRTHRMWWVVTGVFRPQARARFRTVLLETGWRALPGRIARYVWRTGHKP